MTIDEAIHTLNAALVEAEKHHPLEGEVYEAFALLARRAKDITSSR